MIGNIASAEDFIRLRAYLDSLAVVRDVRPTGAQDNRLMVRLALATGLERFDAMLDMGGVLAPDGSDPDNPRYRLLR